MLIGHGQLVLPADSMLGSTVSCLLLKPDKLALGCISHTHFRGLMSLAKKPVGSGTMAECRRAVLPLMLETGAMQAPLQRHHLGCAGTLCCRHQGDSQAHLRQRAPE